MESTQPRSPISLVMTILNEAANIRTFLETLATQSRVPDEIVIVDGGSSDGTVAAITDWADSVDIQCHVHVEPGVNISRGRNLAIARAQHDHILVSDAGVKLLPGWVHTLADALDSGAEVACGFYAPQQGGPLFQESLARIITPTLNEIDPEAFLPSSRSVGFTRHAWTVASGYPEWLDYCEDLVFDMAMRDAGLTFAFCPEAIATWDARADVRSYAKQYYRYARGDGKADLYRKRHAARYTAYAAGCALLVAAPRHPRWAAVALPLGGSVYLGKFAQRVWSARTEVGNARTAAAMALMPALVATGDISKMVGYPVGVAWRMKNRSESGDQRAA